MIFSSSVAQLLLSLKEVDINQGSDFGATALHFAAHRGHMNVVKGMRCLTLPTLI